MRGAGVKRAQFKRRAVVRYLFEQTTMTCWRAGNHIITDLLGSLTEPWGKAPQPHTGEDDKDIRRNNQEHCRGAATSIVIDLPQHACIR